MEQINYNKPKSGAKGIVSKMNKEIEDEIVAVPEKVKPITSAVEQKPSLMKRFFKSVVGGNGDQKLHEYLLFSIIGPAVKQAIVDSVYSTINMLMYKNPGGNNPNNIVSINQGRPYQNYNQISQRRGGQRIIDAAPMNSNVPATQRSNRDIRMTDYIIPTRVDAVQVLRILVDSCTANGFVSYADYLDLIGVGSVFTDHNFGWSNLSYVQIVPVGDGYKLTLPDLEYA